MIVAAYRSGDGINKVIDSLDAQTLPQEQFETIIVDDGSPDDTYQRLLELAADRPNLQVSRIENSGWPSRPRNVATAKARGDYVLYMDHDDSLYPSALARIVAFAEETGADVISPKESKTSEVWWAMPALADGNAADVKADDAIGRILPMVPHKVYRRAFLEQHHITFPEGRRQLWEDVYFNVEAWAKADRVAVLADTPVYLWHESGENNSGSYGATDAEYWDRLGELMEFIDTTLSGPQFEAVHKTMLVHQYQGRILRRLGRQLQDASPDEIAEAMRRAQALQQRFIPEDWDSRLGFFAQLRAWMLRHNRPDLLLELHRAYEAVSMKTTVSAAEWVDGVLQLTTQSRWLRASPAGLGFVRVGDRVLMELPAAIREAVPSTALDVTERIDRYQQTFGVRARAELITWQLPAETHVQFVEAGARQSGAPLATESSQAGHWGPAETPYGGERVELVAHSVVRLDPGRAAFGDALAQTVWDLTTISRWDALAKGSSLAYSGPALPALVDGLAGVAYATTKHKLALDLGGRLRNVALEARLVPPAGGWGPGSLALPLGGVAVHGLTDRPAGLVWRRDGSAPGDGDAVDARLVGDGSAARLELDTRPRLGSYRLGLAGYPKHVSRTLLTFTPGRLWIQDRPRQVTVRARLARLRTALGWRLRRLRSLGR